MFTSVLCAALVSESFMATCYVAVRYSTCRRAADSLEQIAVSAAQVDRGAAESLEVGAAHSDLPGSRLPPCGRLVAGCILATRAPGSPDRR